MTLFRVQTGTVLRHEGPIFENLNFIDNSAAKTATLLHIHQMNRWTVRNCTFRDANGSGGIGMLLTKEVGGDNAWGVIDQCIWKNCETGIKAEGVFTFTVLAGMMEAFTTGAVGINLDDLTQGVHIIGHKIDSGTPSVLIEGSEVAIVACMFEQHGTQVDDLAIRINDTGSNRRGKRNIIMGNVFTGHQGDEIGIQIKGTAPAHNQLIGNVYTNLGTNVDDQTGVSTMLIGSMTEPTVTGARDETEGALKSLLTELAAAGLITDSSTAS